MTVPTDSDLQTYERVNRIKDAAFEVEMLSRAIARSHEHLSLAFRAVVNISARLDRQQRELARQNKRLETLIVNPNPNTTQGETE